MENIIWWSYVKEHHHRTLLLCNAGSIWSVYTDQFVMLTRKTRPWQLVMVSLRVVVTSGVVNFGQWVVRNRDEFPSEARPRHILAAVVQETADQG